FTATPSPALYTLSLHDALPICHDDAVRQGEITGDERGEEIGQEESVRRVRTRPRGTTRPRRGVFLRRSQQAERSASKAQSEARCVEQSEEPSHGGQRVPRLDEPQDGRRARRAP